VLDAYDVVALELTRALRHASLAQLGRMLHASDLVAGCPVPFGQLGFNDYLRIEFARDASDCPRSGRVVSREGGLLRPSMAKCEQITTLRRERLSPPPLGGGLSRTRMIEVEKAILRAIGVPIS
jgi:hypothetical protein